MSKLMFRSATAAVAALCLAAAANAADNTRAPGTTPGSGPVRVNPDIVIAIQIDCVVRGTPTEFPDDIWLTNVGPTAVPAGYKVKWELLNSSGIYTFAAPLQPSKGIIVTGVLPGGRPAGTPCSVGPVN